MLHLNFLISSELCVVTFYWLTLLRFFLKVDISSTLIISVIMLALATNPFFGVLKTLNKIIQWFKARRYKVNTNVTADDNFSNIWHKRTNISLTTKAGYLEK